MISLIVRIIIRVAVACCIGCAAGAAEHNAQKKHEDAMAYHAAAATVPMEILRVQHPGARDSIALLYCFVVVMRRLPMPKENYRGIKLGDYLVRLREINLRLPADQKAALNAVPLWQTQQTAVAPEQPASSAAAAPPPPMYTASAATGGGTPMMTPSAPRPAAAWDRKTDADTMPLLSDDLPDYKP